MGRAVAVVWLLALGGGHGGALLHPGCYAEVHFALDLGDGTTTGGTRRQCATQCAQHGYPLAGVTFGSRCMCAGEEQPAMLRVPASECGLPCLEGPGTCGGFDAADLVLTSATHSPVVERSGPLHVVVCSERGRLPGLLAVINSVGLNTPSRVTFHVFTDLRSHRALDVALSLAFPFADIQLAVFDESLVAGKIRVLGKRQSLANPLNYARYFLPQLLPHVADRVIFLDDDVIVQGDLEELVAVDLAGSSLGTAFSSDCNPLSRQYGLFENKYEHFLNFANARIQQLGIDPKTCGFNAGVFVADLAVWRAENVTAQLVRWLELNTHEVVYGNGQGGGGSQPPMLIVFHKAYAELDPMWHVRSLGSQFGQQLPKRVAAAAKLLHWSGARKAWAPGANPKFQLFYELHAVRLGQPGG